MVRHADIVEVSKNTDVFVSGYGVMFDVLPPVFLQMAMSFLAMDNPQHDKVRGLVGKAFTRPQIRRIDDDIASRARRIVATAREKATAGEPVDFVSDISRHLPIEMFGDMFGVPRSCGRPSRTSLTRSWRGPIRFCCPDATAPRCKSRRRRRSTRSLSSSSRSGGSAPPTDVLTNLVQAEVRW